MNKMKLYHQIALSALMFVLIIFSVNAALTTSIDSPSNLSSTVFNENINFNSTFAKSAIAPDAVGVTSIRWDSNADGSLSTLEDFSSNTLTVGRHVVSLDVNHYINNAISFKVKSTGLENWQTTSYYQTTRTKCTGSNETATGIGVGAGIGAIAAFATGNPIVGIVLLGGGAYGVSETRRDCGAETYTASQIDDHNAATDGLTGLYNTTVNYLEGTKTIGTYQPPISTPNGGAQLNVTYALVDVTINGNYLAGPVVGATDGNTSILIDPLTGAVTSTTAKFDRIKQSIEIDVNAISRNVTLQSITGPTKPVLGYPMTINASIKNNSNVDEPAITLMYWMNGDRNQTTFSLNRGLATNVSLSYIPTSSGINPVIMSLIPLPTEVNIVDNNVSQDFNVQNPRDVLLVQVSAPDNVYADNSFDVNSYVTNNSDIALNNIPLYITLGAGLGLDLTEVATKTIPVLNPAQQTNVAWDVNSLFSGTWDANISAFYDANGWDRITVLSTANRSITNVNAPTTGFAGYPTTYQVTVKNNGIFPDSFIVRLFTDGADQNNVLVNLASGASTTIDLSYTYPLINVYNYTMAIDANSSESNLIDNNTIGSVNVIDPNGNVSVSLSGPNTVYTSTDFNVTMYVWNMTADSINNVPVSIALNGIDLSVGENVNKTITGPIASGNFATVKWSLKSRVGTGAIDANVTAYTDSNAGKTINVILNQSRVINSLTLPSPAIADNNLTFIVELSNNGAVQENFVIRFFVNNNQTSSNALTMNSGQIADVNFYYLFTTAGTYDINTSIDAGQFESNVTDNNSYAPLNVVDANTVINVTVSSPANVLANDPFQVKGYVWNLTATNMYNVPIYLDLNQSLQLPGLDYNKIIPVVLAGDSAFALWDVNATLNTGAFDMNVTAYNNVRKAKVVNVQ